MNRTTYTPAQLATMADDAIIRHDYSRAIELYVRALKNEPDNPQWRYQLGIAYTRVMDLDEAAKQFRLILDGSYTFVHANHIRIMLGYIYNLQGLYDDSENVLGQALEFSPENMTALQCLGYAFYRRSKMKEALAVYTRILELDQTHANALNAMGTLLIESEADLSQGVEYVRKALSMQPQNPAFLDSLGWGLFKLGDEAAAIEHLRQAFELAPNQAEIKAHLRQIMNV